MAALLCLHWIVAGYDELVWNKNYLILVLDIKCHNRVIGRSPLNGLRRKYKTCTA